MTSRVDGDDEAGPLDETSQGNVSPNDALPDEGASELSRGKRFVQSVGAIIVTGLVFYFLLGVPGYLLFGKFFE